MEDPWNSPWATETSAKPHVHDQEMTVPPWDDKGEEDDAWGGWSDAANQKSDAAPRWAEVSTTTWNDAALGGIDEMRTSDSAISLGENSSSLQVKNEGTTTATSTNDDTWHAESPAAEPTADVEDIMGAPQTENPTESVATRSTRTSLDIKSASSIVDGRPEALAEQEVVEAAVDGSAIAVSETSAISDDSTESLPENGKTASDISIDSAGPDTDESPESKQDVEDGPQATKGLHFPIDFSILDRVFPGTTATSITGEALPEAIVRDSFASVGERKAWHRISRFGSLHRANSGDDESYVRVSWPGSTVRKDTLAIVRRWMEEDSMGGRVVMGKRTAHGGAGMFNWGSDAPQVEIGELLAKRRHSRKVSASMASAASPTTPSFTWSSMPSSPESVTRSKPTPLSNPPRSSLSISKPLEMKPVQQPVSAERTQEVDDDDNDDDDDWGEMMTSPPVGSSSFTADGNQAITSIVDAGHATSTAGGLNIITAAGEWNGQTTDRTPTSGPATPVPQAETEPSGQAPIAKGHLLSSEESGDEAESAQDEEIVQSILSGLPDLSYMLR